MWVEQEQTEWKCSFASMSDPIRVYYALHGFLNSFFQLRFCIFLSVQDYEIEYMEKIGSSSAVSIKVI